MLFIIIISKVQNFVSKKKQKKNKQNKWRLKVFSYYLLLQKDNLISICDSYHYNPFLRKTRMLLLFMIFKSGLLGLCGLVWMLLMRYFLIVRQRNRNIIVSLSDAGAPLLDSSTLKGKEVKTSVPWVFLFTKPAFW